MANKEPIVHTVELPVPDVGLSAAQVDELSTKFKTNLIETMGGEKAMALRVQPIIIVVSPRIVIVVER